MSVSLDVLECCQVQVCWWSLAMVRWWPLLALWRQALERRPRRRLEEMMLLELLVLRASSLGSVGGCRGRRGCEGLHGLESARGEC